MLNTEWRATARNFSPVWHGYAWGAECAWNASTTEPKDFNRRIGAVLFGEKGDHFGQAIESLAWAHCLSIAATEYMPCWMIGMSNARFWQKDFLSQPNYVYAHARVDPLLGVVRPGIAHLEACKKDATVNADMLDAFLLERDGWN